MSAYVYPNYLTKKALKEGVKAGAEVICRENTPYGQERIFDGEAYVEGPHYPKPHRWYAKVWVRNGSVVKVK